MKMCIVRNSIRKPKCEKKEYFLSESLNPLKKYALAENKDEVLDKYRRLVQEDKSYDIGENPYVYLIGNEWHLSDIDQEDQLEELSEEETKKFYDRTRDKALGVPSVYDDPKYDPLNTDIEDGIIKKQNEPYHSDDDPEFFTEDIPGGARRRRKSRRRKVRKTLARKSRRSKTLNRKRQKKSRRKYRKR